MFMGLNFLLFSVLIPDIIRLQNALGSIVSVDRFVQFNNIDKINCSRNTVQVLPATFPAASCNLKLIFEIKSAGSGFSTLIDCLAGYCLMTAIQVELQILKFAAAVGC